MNPLVSIIMPAYNAEKTIEEAINSILKQTYTNFELIICDDGSTDQTIEKIRTINDKRIKLIINEKNLGNLHTTNKLFLASKGVYIALQDADDFSLKYRLEKQVKILENKDVDLVGTQAGNWFNGDVISVTSYPEMNEDILEIMLKSPRVPIVWGSVLFKKKIYEDIGGFDVIFNRIGAADYNWLQRVSFKYSFYNIPENLYLYRNHADSFTKNTDTQSISRMYSENIAFDIFIFSRQYGYYESNKAKEIFKLRETHYQTIFSKDEGILIGRIYTNFLFGKIKFTSYLREVIRSKTTAKIKIKYIAQGSSIYLIGVRNFEKIKKLIR